MELGELRPRSFRNPVRDGGNVSAIVINGPKGQAHFKKTDTQTHSLVVIGLLTKRDRTLSTGNGRGKSRWRYQQQNLDCSQI